MNLYKEILDELPTAAVVLDGSYKVRYFNRAFREYFPLSRRSGYLSEVIGCGERECGKTDKCEICPVRGPFREALEKGGASFKKLLLRGGNGKSVSLQIKVKPLGDLLLGIIDPESEIAIEMHSAQDIQQRLLPPANSPIGVPYSFLFVPCREIGGDLPDVYEIGGNSAAILADVSGKGISAGMLSAFVKACWDRTEPSPAKALQKLNEKFAELNLDERSYVTAAAAIIEKGTNRIRYCVAGHNAPILLKTEKGIDEIVMSSPPISNWMPDFGYEDRYLEYHRGDILVLLTDGVIESRNQKGEQFSLERVEEILQRSYSAEKFIEKLKASLTEFCGSFDDDLTAMAFEL